MTQPPPSGGGSHTGVLERFMADISVDDYADAPPRDRVESVPVRRVATWLGLAVGIAVGVVIVGALLNTRLSTASRQETRDALVERVQSLSESVALQERAVDTQSQEVASLQSRVLGEADAGPERAAVIATLSDSAATSEMEGPGVIVSVDDAPDAAAGSLNRVLDRDLQDVVNALWRSGARGVAINGERLTATTAIRGAGEAILVNYRPLIRPYAITAVGAADARSDVAGLLGRLSSDYGLVTDIRGADVTLPAGELRSPRFASTLATDAEVAGR